MIVEIKTEIEKFVIERIDRLTFEELMIEVYGIYVIYEQMGYAVHVYMKLKLDPECWNFFE